MDKIKIGGSKPHFGNNQFRLNGGLKKDNDYQCACLVAVSHRQR